MRADGKKRWAEREKHTKHDKEDQPDEPVTITERQLRHLKIGATAGLVAVVLAFAATGLAAWSLMKVPDEVGPTSASTEGQPVAQAGMAPAVNPEGAPPASPAPQPSVGAAAAPRGAPAAAVQPPAAGAGRGQAGGNHQDDRPSRAVTLEFRGLTRHTGDDAGDVAHARDPGAVRITPPSPIPVSRRRRAPPSPTQRADSAR